jgi:pimeloyl-ACP methyl ester carboxylesterase
MQPLTEHIDCTEASRVRWADLAGRPRGDGNASGRSFVFLHGLTFDHRMWDPVMEALPSGHQAIAFDLPGHGGSPALADHDLEAVADAINAAVRDAGMAAPIVVGHSIGGPLASLYAVRHPAAAVVSIDAPVLIAPFAQFVQSLSGQLTGDGFEETWAMFRESMHIERVPEANRGLLSSGERATRQQVLTYWARILERAPDELTRWVDEQLELARAAVLPYLVLHGDPVDAEERAYLHARLPQAEIVVWPVGHHFPHLADPVRFAELLTAFAAGLPVPLRAPTSTRGAST